MGLQFEIRIPSSSEGFIYIPPSLSIKGMEKYPKNFYRDQQAGAKKSAKVIVPMVMELMEVKSVLDVGCGTGAWLSEFSEHGVDEIRGIDGEWVDRNILKIPKNYFSTHDLKYPFDMKREYDLVMSLEVAEHLPKESTGSFVRSLTKHGPVVLFSAAIPFQGGTKHKNEQWQDYWVKLFGQYDYAVLDPIRDRIWNDQDVDFWYAQNILLFVRNDHLAGQPALHKEMERTRDNQISIVHPYQHLVMQARTDPKFMSLKDVIRAIPILLKDRVLGRKRSMI
jgi:SAM-dependent methyltransferase